MSEEYAANRSKIKAQLQTVRQITSTPDHPNEKFEEGTKLVTATVKRDVALAWSRIYTEQKASVLKWPQKLGEDFLQWMDVPSNATANIPREYRERYLNYVKNEFPRLLEIVDARPWFEEDQAGGGDLLARRREMMDGPAPGVAGAVPLAPLKEYRINWDKKNQQFIDESLEFKAGNPSNMEVRFCQENLWVYHALLNAIAYINKDATGNHNAKIKEIISLNIGQDASALLIESLANGRIVLPEGATPPVFAPLGGEASADGTAAPAAAPSRMMEDEGPMGGRFPGGGGALSGRAPDDLRYVDDKGMPIPTGVAGPAEFKRMPIVMQLFMDQREVAGLLVRLANSPLPVEIRQMRINTKMQGFNNPRLPIFAGKDGAVDTRKGTGNAMMRDKNMEEAMLNPYDVAVELHGIIYIFNPPDQSLRATDSPAGDAATAADPPAAAAAPPTAAPTDTPADEAVPGADTSNEGNATEPKPAEIPATDADASAFDQAAPAVPPPAADPPAAGKEEPPLGEQ